MMDLMVKNDDFNAHGQDFNGDLHRRPELVERVLSSKAAMRDPVSVGTIAVRKYRDNPHHKSFHLYPRRSLTDCLCFQQRRFSLL